MSALNLRTQITEDYLTCPICCNSFTQPKALPCIHTFCESCLRDYVYSRGYESLGEFPCPICRTECIMPSQGVAGFPNNHVMSSLSDTVNKASPSRPVPMPRRSLATNPSLQQSPVVDPSEGTDIDNPHPTWDSGTDPQPYKNMHRPLIADLSPPTKTKGFNQGGVQTTAGPDGFEVIDSNPNNNGSSVDNSPPPPYSSVADTKVCAKDEDAGWMVVPTDGKNGVTPTVPPIGWNVPAATNLPASMNDAQIRRNDFLPCDNSSNFNSQSVLYPSVQSNLLASTVCAENLTLRFGKLGSTPRDFLRPASLAINKDGHFIVLDCGGEQHRIMIFNSGGEITSAFRCNAKVNNIAITQQDEIIASVDKASNSIRLFTIGGKLKGEFGKFFTYEQPSGLAELKDGGVVLTGVLGHCVYVLNQQMKLSNKFGRKGNGDGYFSHPAFVAVDSKQHIIVTDKANGCVQVFGEDGKFKRRFGFTGPSAGQLQAPLGVCVDSLDNIIIADSGNCRVEVFSPNGQWLCSVVKSTHQLGENVRPVDVAMTPTGKVAVLLCGPYFAEVRVYSSRHQQIRPLEASPHLLIPCWKSG